MNAITQEQSRHLIELGVNLETADALYGVPTIDIKPNLVAKFNKEDYEKYIEINPMVKDLITPAWSLDALLDLIPGAIDYHSEIVHFRMTKHEIWYETNEHNKIIVFTRDYKTSRIDIAYNMVCWLIENNYIIFKETNLN